VIKPRFALENRDSASLHCDMPLWHPGSFSDNVDDAAVVQSLAVMLSLVLLVSWLGNMWIVDEKPLET